MGGFSYLASRNSFRRSLNINKSFSHVCIKTYRKLKCKTIYLFIFFINFASCCTLFNERIEERFKVNFYQRSENWFKIKHKRKKKSQMKIFEFKNDKTLELNIDLSLSWTRLFIFNEYLMIVKEIYWYFSLLLVT